ncbi:MAG: type I-U CRISPR-associated helicase/endonuclease Cas3 [Planctomycetes bacterium]|nr:type I-U CRISPR-associated helicase/endonuclease Cas3 [Planctomycetota bacterium]
MKETTEHDDLLTEVLGRTPFPWQRRLLAQLSAGAVPRALDLPTGLGKTSVMAVWLAARVSGATDLPRRLVYIVDRRAVVDQATREAERLRVRVAEAGLGRALGLGGQPLPISTLRGQFIDNREWLEDPASPAIVVGTVDMIGSRLLFEGYASSRRMRPYHAALLGNDALFVLDESHLVPPFEHLLEAVCGQDDLRDAAGPANSSEPTAVRRPKLLALSATGRQHDSAFRLDDNDRTDPTVRQRLHATKGLVIKELPAGATLDEALARRAWDLAESAGHPVRVLVFSNRREVAEKAAAQLIRLARRTRERGVSLPSVELFVGERRTRERSLAAEHLEAMGFLAGAARPDDHAFVFATSAGEVGVDLDADHLVCDCVAWERLVQRFGRVNRRGEGSARIELLLESTRDGAPEGTAAHGALLGLLRELPMLPDGARDASPSALDDLRRTAAERVAVASTPAPLRPPLSRAVLDAWSMTSLREHTGRPEVRPWLRGWVEDEPQTILVWRSMLPPASASDAEFAAYCEAAAPHSSEQLQAETWHVWQWLRDRSARLRNSAAGETDRTMQSGDVLALVTDQAGEFLQTITLAHLESAVSSLRDRDRFQRGLAHRTLLIDARLGGLSASGLLDAGIEEAPETADRHSETDATWLPALDGQVPVVRFRLSHSDRSEATTDPAWRERLRLPFRRAAGDEDVTEWLVVEKWRHDAATEEDRSEGRPQSLEEHETWVANEAAELATRLGLSDGQRRVLAVAARLHDEGKRADRWQRAFHAPRDTVYAKTRGPVDVRLLDGYRHELGSLTHVRRDPEFRTLSEEDQDLVLHLVTAHHGFSRPLIGTRGLDHLPPSRAEHEAAEVALRFARLQERFGPWGLAWWETLLRAADQRASRRNDEREDR